MAGLKNICKMYGGFTIGGIHMVYDYDADEAVHESEMPLGSERWRRSERARYAGHFWQDVQPDDFSEPD